MRTFARLLGAGMLVVAATALLPACRHHHEPPVRQVPGGRRLAGDDAAVHVPQLGNLPKSLPLVRAGRDAVATCPAPCRVEPRGGPNDMTTVSVDRPGGSARLS